MYPERPAGIAYGGDYNPEQWPREVLEEDVSLMREAGVNLVSLGMFSWALMEPEPGRFAFGWLDEVIDRLHRAGVAVDLATPTAAPPAWLVAEHPDVLPVTREGLRIGFGGRQSACSSAPAFLEATGRLVRALGEHYRGHPAVVMWHVHNEYGAPLGECYCEHSVAAWRRWLEAAYRDVSALNEAWGGTFWGQTYTDWSQIDAPRANHTTVNPAQRLDYARFSDGQHRAHYALQRDILREVAPGVPVTTNFAGTVNCKSTDLWQWARELDVIANDHYLQAERPDNHIDLAMSADLARSVAGGEPWMLMEHSAGAVNWQPRNLAKTPGELRRNSLSHLARGADGIMFFQWRQSRAGAEKWHSAMLPHAGTGTKVWREVVALGAELASLAEVAGSTVTAEVALLVDHSSVWAQDHPAQPTADLDPVEEAKRWHAALWRAGVTCDVAHPEGDLSGYRLVLVPQLYLVSDAGAANLEEFARRGGVVLVGPYSGIVDEHDRVRLGGYPGAWRDLLGVSTEEFLPLAAPIRLASGATGTVWSEAAQATTAKVLDTYVSGEPAWTRNDYGDGAAHYLTTVLDDAALAEVLATVCREAEVAPPAASVPGVEVVRRSHADGRSFLFAINHTDRDATVTTEAGEAVTVPAGDALVIPLVTRAP